MQIFCPPAPGRTRCLFDFAFLIGLLYIIASVFQIIPAHLPRSFPLLPLLTRSILLESLSALSTVLPISLQVRCQEWKQTLRKISDIAWLVSCSLGVLSVPTLCQRLLLALWIIPAYVDPYTYMPPLFIRRVRLELLPTVELVRRSHPYITVNGDTLSDDHPLFEFICAARAELADAHFVLRSFAAASSIPSPHGLIHAAQTCSSHIINKDFMVKFVLPQDINPLGKAQPLVPPYGKIEVLGHLQGIFAAGVCIDERLAKLWEDERREDEPQTSAEYRDLLKAVLWRGMLKVVEIEMTREFEGDYFV